MVTQCTHTQTYTGCYQGISNTHMFSVTMVTANILYFLYVGIYAYIHAYIFAPSQLFMHP